MNEEKKKIAFSAMQTALKEKEQKVEAEKLREKMENEKYLAFIKEKEKMAQEIKEKKAEADAAKYAYKYPGVLHKQAKIVWDSGCIVQYLQSLWQFEAVDSSILHIWRYMMKPVCITC